MRGTQQVVPYCHLIAAMIEASSKQPISEQTLAGFTPSQGIERPYPKINVPVLLYLPPARSLDIQPTSFTLHWEYEMNSKARYPLILAIFCCFLASSCGGKSEDSSAGNNVQSLRDTITIVRNANGTFYVKCKDGTEETRTEDDILRNNVCLSSGGSGGSSASCANAAYRGPFSREESISLCSGATSTAPADCGINAYRGPFSTTEAVQLCRRALNNAPADCAIMAYRGPFSKAEAASLCAGVTSTAPAECAINAYRGPYSKEEAIRLCKNN